jgi:hypothetical protein
VKPYDVSPAALKPLLHAFWSPQGWKRPPELPSGPAMQQAVDNGVLFENPRSLNHDGWVQAARSAAAAVSLEEISEAFVASLSTGRLDLRSALGSYVVARHLPEHPFVIGNSNFCATCGLYPDSTQDLNVLNFERHKWGGVRRDSVVYVAFDLEQFRRAPRLPADATSTTLGRQLLDALRSAPPNETATTAEKLIRTLKGNAAERHCVLDILGVCGVLESQDHRGHRLAFVPVEERDIPAQHYVERTYPASWWRGADGVNEKAVEELLPTLA